MSTAQILDRSTTQVGRTEVTVLTVTRTKEFSEPWLAEVVSSDGQRVVIATEGSAPDAITAAIQSVAHRQTS